MTDTTDILYREIQRFRQPLIWIFLIFASLFSLYAMVQQIILGKAFGNNPAPDSVLIVMVIFFGFGLPIFFYSINLTTKVRRDGLYYRFFPFHISYRKIELADISSYKVRTYRPVKEYGGWGIRYGRNSKAYNVSGNRGVQLELAHGTGILFGSQRPEELAEALNSALRQRRL